MESFSIIDAVILGIIGLSVITGLVRGFVKELIALCVWVIAIWLGITYANDVGSYFKAYISDETIRHAAGFIIILLLTIISGSLFNALLSFILKNTGLSGTDRLLGMVFGLVRGVFIVSLIILAGRVTSFIPPDKQVRQSMLYSKFTPLVDWMYEVAPDFIKEAKSPEANAEEESKALKDDD